MGGIKESLSAADRFQQGRPALAFPVAVWSKFKDDKAGNLAALIAYYAFVALFPLLLVLVTVLNIVLRNDPSLRNDLVNSAVAQYPVIGPEIQRSLGSLPAASGLPLVIGLVLLLLGARGVAGALQNAMYGVWGIGEESRPKFLMSQLWGMALVFTIGIGFIVTTFLSGVAGGVGNVINGAVAHVGTVLVSLVLNVGVFWLGFRLAAAFRVRWRDVRAGAVIAAVCWQVLQLAGGLVVGHLLRRSSELYGTFGIVLGLLAWLYLEAEVTLFAAEVDVVLARHLWPRSMLPAEPAAAAGSVDAAVASPATAAPPAATASPTPPAAASPGDPASVSVPAPRGPAERSGDDEKRTASWISRARRAVGRR
jgi:YihY family inner membrane protein